MIDAKKIKRDNIALANYFRHPIEKILWMDLYWTEQNINSEKAGNPEPSRDYFRLVNELLHGDYFKAQEYGGNFAVSNTISRAVKVATHRKRNVEKQEI